MQLADLNERWQQTNHPYAVPEGTGHHWFCPLCGAQGPNQESLMGAMSDSLVHKGSCVAVG